MMGGKVFGVVLGAWFGLYLRDDVGEARPEGHLAEEDVAGAEGAGVRSRMCAWWYGVRTEGRAIVG